MAEVTLTGVNKVYPSGVNAIQGIDLSIADGEFIVLVGPSGCGKSTLLRMIAGLETITVGDIAINGLCVNSLEPADRDIAMVFQNYALYPHMTVYNNMAYGLKNQGTPRDEIERRIGKAAEILGLGSFLNRKPRQLSGGQRQRVAMGRAIVREPQVFLFDEPLSNLDAKLRVQMRLEIKRLQRALGITAIYVTHDQVEAMTLADRLVVMNAGRAEQIGGAIDVYNRPATTFVAGFIGSPAMNFLKATVESSGTMIRLPNGDGIPMEHPANTGSVDQPVTLGIRPEHLIPADGNGSGTFHVNIDMVEELGADTLVHGTLNGNGELLTARLPGNHAIPGDGVLRFHVAPENAHVFATETGTRIT